MPRSVSIKDIAQMAGVSPSTVSRALRADPRISQERSQLILRLAQDTGYTPSLAARHLVTQQTNTIGLVLSYLSDLYVGSLVASIEEAAMSLGYSVFLISSYRDAKREQEAVRSLHERRTAGIIVTGSQIDEGYVQLRMRYAQPVVLINCPRYPHSISSDNLAGARQAVEHLVRLGHRQIAYIADPRSHGANLDRLTGYRTVLAQYQIPIDPEWIVEGDGSMAGAQRAVQQLLACRRRPTAIFCFNDLTAMVALGTLNQAGLHVPADCSVIGFDDLELAPYCCPPLTTVRQHRDQLGQRAVHMLHRLIQGQCEVQPEVLPAELVVRETAGLAPALAGGREEVIGF